MTPFSTPPAHVISSNLQIVILSEEGVRKANDSASKDPVLLV
jgi:hypothetical protein